MLSSGQGLGLARNQEFIGITSHPTIIIGDCNEILDAFERGSHFIVNSGSKDFKDFVQNLGLVEIHANNGWFTWYRGVSKSKLDRLLLSLEWLSISSPISNSCYSNTMCLITTSIGI